MVHQTNSICKNKHLCTIHIAGALTPDNCTARDVHMVHKLMTTPFFLGATVSMHEGGIVGTLGLLVI